MKKRSGKRAVQPAESSVRRIRLEEAAASEVPVPWANPAGPAHVYIGPSLDGVDKEYVKIVSGRITDRKPSFA